MSYRINKDESVTPYSNSRVKDSGKCLNVKNSLNRKTSTSKQKSRPMSHTFNNSQRQANKIESRLVIASKDFEKDRLRNMRSSSRKEKIKSKQCKVIK